MSYIARKEVALRDERYQKLTNKQANIERTMQDWMDEATQLHTDSSDASDKADLIALKDAFVASLRVILGV